MTAEQFVLILPLLILAGTAVVVMLGLAFFRHHGLTFFLTLAGLTASFATLFFLSPKGGQAVTSLLVIDSYAVFYFGLILAASFAVALLAYDYWERVFPGQGVERRSAEGPAAENLGASPRTEEFYLLLLLATLGSVVLVCSCHFASFFLGLELLSVSLYPMIGYRPGVASGLEAALKYLVMAGVSSAFLLFGMALVYAYTGTLQFAEMAARLHVNIPVSMLLWTGLGLIIVGFGFKLALVPFHLWTPDVYQGAPAPTTAFIATVSKGAMFALLLRYFSQINVHSQALFVVFAVMSVASMVAGNLLALLQTNVKRVLAYSSIAHLGYLLVAFLATGPMVSQATSFYLVSYFVTTLGAFGIVSMLSGRLKEAETLEAYQGLAWRHPWLAAAFSAMLLSLAGIPFSVGFIGKFYVLTAAAGSGLWWLLIILVCASAIGLFYYLRIIIAMCRPVAEGGVVPGAVRPFSASAGIALTALSFLLVLLGIYPSPLLQYLHSTFGLLK